MSPIFYSFLSITYQYPYFSLSAISVDKTHALLKATIYRLPKDINPSINHIISISYHGNFVKCSFYGTIIYQLWNLLVLSESQKLYQRWLKFNTLFSFSKAESMKSLTPSVNIDAMTLKFDMKHPWTQSLRFRKNQVGGPCKGQVLAV